MFIRLGARAAAARLYDLFVTTKLWIQDSGEERTRRAFEESLRRLGLE